MNLIFEITLIELHREAAVDNNDGGFCFFRYFQPCPNEDASGLGQFHPGGKQH